MAITLSAIITAARDKSPHFFRSRITDAVVARHLSDVQNDLLGAAIRRDGQYLAQTANIVLSLSDDSAPGTAGAGTAGGVPGTSDSDGVFSTTESTVGALVEANTTEGGGATRWMTDRVCASATATTITSTGAGRTTNQDVGRVIVITKGTGIGQRREVLSNTASQWAISTGADDQAWETVPDSTSMFDVVTPAYASDNTIGVATAVPSTQTTAGYLVKVTAGGVPYIDFTQPLVATMDASVPLPAMQFPIDGTVWYLDGSKAPLAITDRPRSYGAGGPTILVDSQAVQLCGEASDWSDVASIALRYAPIAPVFTALTDVFLLPDHARPVLVAKAEAFMALRVAASPDVSIDPTPHLANAQAAERAFLNNVTHAKRGRFSRIQERW